MVLGFEYFAGEDVAAFLVGPNTWQEEQTILPHFLAQRKILSAWHQSCHKAWHHSDCPAVFMSADKGKHVFCTTTFCRGRQIVAAAEQAGMVASAAKPLACDE